MIDRAVLRTFLGQPMISSYLAQASVHLGQRSAQAGWIWLCGARGDVRKASGWLVESELLSEPVFDDDGARYYGDDVCTIGLGQQPLPAGESLLVQLSLPAVIRVDLYAGTIDGSWVDKGVLLTMAGDQSLLLSVESSRVVLDLDRSRIASTLEGWDDDWPELTVVESCS